MYKKNKAFTLVELIVVIIILAILGTIAFLSLQGYSKTARDSRRIADISNIKTSLELFILNTGKYPLPDVDGSGAVTYSGDLLWIQGTIGDNVAINLSKNLQEKPLEPLFDIEYTYSLANNNKEYQLMTLYESEISKTNNLINNTYAANTYNIKVEGTYNEIFLKTPYYIVPVPSIITSEELPFDLHANTEKIESMVVTNGINLPNLNIPNTTVETGKLDIKLSVYTGTLTKNSDSNDKKNVIAAIQNAYTGSMLSTQTIYLNLLNTTEPEILADKLILNNYNTIPSNSCNDITKPNDNGNIIFIVNPSEVNQEYIQGSSECGYECKNGYSGEDCDVAPTTCDVGISEITLTNGQTWKCMDVGATTVWNGIDTFNCTSATDCSNKPSYVGDWYQFGRNDIGWTNDWNTNNWGEGGQGPCDTGWHVPTRVEWGNAATNIGTDIPTFKNKLKIVFAGLRHQAIGGNYSDWGITGIHWSSSPVSNSNGYAMYMSSTLFIPERLNRINTVIDMGFNVRCIKN